MTAAFIEHKARVEAGIDKMATPDLVDAWHAYASSISYHHADDSGKEWGIAKALRPDFLAIETEILKRGEPAPEDRGYLLGFGWRVGDRKTYEHIFTIRVQVEASDPKEATRKIHETRDLIRKRLPTGAAFIYITPDPVNRRAFHDANGELQS